MIQKFYFLLGLLQCFNMINTKILIFFVIAILPCKSVRVCETFLDYYNPLSPRCYDNPDAERNVVSIFLIIIKISLSV